MEENNPIAIIKTAPIFKKPENFVNGEALLLRAEPIKNKIIPIITVKITIFLNLIKRF